MIICALISNFLSLHQLGIARELASAEGVIFRFVSCYGPSGEKKDLSSNEHDPFVIRVYESQQAKEEAIKFLQTCDFVIFGSGDRSLLDGFKKLIFFYAEHFSKDWLFPLRAIHVHFLYKPYQNAYLLCASSKAAKDFRTAGLFENRCYKYGYFPNVQPKARLRKLSSPTQLLWAARDLSLKRLRHAFVFADSFAKTGAPFRLKIVTKQNETLKKNLQHYSKKKWFANVSVLDPMSNEELLQLMRDSEIFLFTSSNGEGWGATLNEAMAQGCLCIASASAGSTGFLIQNGKNGYTYASEKELKGLAKKIGSHGFDTFEPMRKAAQETMEKLWNPKEAAQRILSLYCDLTSRNEFDPTLHRTEGPGKWIA